MGPPAYSNVRPAVSQRSTHDPRFARPKPTIMKTMAKPRSKPVPIAAPRHPVPLDSSFTTAIVKLPVSDADSPVV